MIEMLSYEFMQRALLAAVIVGVLCSVVAFFVVLKKLSFVGVGVSHSALGGVALGVITGIDPVVTGGIFATAVAWLIGWVSRKGHMSEDTVIGTFFSASMALGVVLLGLAKSYTADLMSFLFGNILAITETDLWLLAGLTAAVLLFVAIFFKELLTMTFDEELARADGLPVGPLYFGLLTTVALTVVVTVKAVGLVLSSALLVIPAAVGFELVKEFRKMLAISVATGVIGSVAGLVISFYFDVASGATIVLCLSAIFLVAYAFSPRKAWVARLTAQRRQKSPSSSRTE